MPANQLPQVNAKLDRVRDYCRQYPDSPHSESAEDLGYDLEHKRNYLREYNSEFGLRKILRAGTPHQEAVQQRLKELEARELSPLSPPLSRRRLLLFIGLPILILGLWGLKEIVSPTTKEPVAVVEEEQLESVSDSLAVQDTTSQDPPVVASDTGSTTNSYKPLIKPSPPSPGPPDNFVRIEGGTFEMGDPFKKGKKNEGESDEIPVHLVELSPFYLSRTEVTFAEYDAFCEATERFKPTDVFNRRDKYPVTDVSWCDAVAYANWLSEERGLEKVYGDEECNNIRVDWSANGYRLPTEAEWEFAARERGQPIRFGNGKNHAYATEINYDARARHKYDYAQPGEYRQETLHVDELTPNSLGLYHMSGNVREWCWDWYKGDYYESRSSSGKNPKGPTSVIERVRSGRGGAYSDAATNVRCTMRYSAPPDTHRDKLVGFRLARSAE